MEEEISLRELIEILLVGKKVIASITILAMLITGVFNFLFLEPTYESKSILMASGINAKTQAGDIKGVESLLNSISPYPQIPIETYKEQIKDPQILDEVIRELDLASYGISRAGLSNMITLSAIANTNLLTIVVQYQEPKMAATIANTVTKKFIASVSAISKEQAEKSSNYLKTQMEVEREKFDEALLEYKGYMSQQKSLVELEKEVESKTSLITMYKEKLLNADIKEQSLIASLETATRELEKMDEKTVLQKSLMDDSVMSQSVKQEINPVEGFYNISIQTEEVNEAYIYLKNKANDIEIQLARIRAQKTALIRAIDSTSKELKELNAELVDKQYNDETLKQKVDFAKSTYEAFLHKYEETKILQSSDIGEDSITIVSHAVESLTPVATNKIKNVAIAGMLGLMISSIFIIFRSYWKVSGVNVK